MRDRHARLARIVALFEVQKRVHQARVARLAGENLKLAARETDLLDLIATADNPSLQLAAARRLPQKARDRADSAAKLETETASRQKAELRARVAGQALTEVRTQIDDRTQRSHLEEMQFATSPASGKFREPKV
ncbi:MAG TPA: hypothetical protein PKA55_03895 [Rhodoblastus sp.]|nr:hypothetical protein [Rhodoblastus sp.]